MFRWSPKYADTIQAKAAASFGSSHEQWESIKAKARQQSYVDGNSDFAA
jgi:hypothetical protein